MRFRLLGPLQVQFDGRWSQLERPRRRAFLSYLLLSPNRIVTTAELADAVWGPTPPATARTQIQIDIAAIRAWLGVRGPAGPIHTRTGGYELRVDPDDIDYFRFRRLRTEAAELERAGRWPQAAERLRASLALARGPALADVVGDFVEVTRGRIEDERVDATERLVQIELDMPGSDDHVATLRQLFDSHPYRERVAELLMVALSRAGRRAEALAVARRLRSNLRDDHGLDPGASFLAVERQILQGNDERVEVRRPARPAGEPTIWHPPAPLADFVGRTAELERIGVAVRNRLDADHAPIVAISGLPGVGKTALAVAAARRFRDAFPGGQLFVDLCGHDVARPPELVLQRFLRTLGVAAQEVPDDPEEAAARYRALLSREPRQVILDNAATAAQVGPLLPPPGCAVLLTSRRLLGDLDGADHMRLGPLAEAEAVDLLARTAGAETVAAAPAAAVAVAQACSYLPLALRIIGARCLRSQVGLAELADQLADAAGVLDHLDSPERSVRASLRSGYDRLDPTERRLLQLLTVVAANDFPAWVVGPALAVSSPVGRSVLGGLVTAGFVQSLGPDRIGQDRFRLHDLVGEFAGELADQAGQDERSAAIERVADAWHALAEESAEALDERTGPNPVRTARGAPSTSAHRRDPDGWFAVESASLREMAHRCAAAGLHRQCWGLIWCSETYLRKDVRTGELIALGQLGLDAAQRADDRLGVACMALMMAASYAMLGNAEAGHRYAVAAVESADDIGDDWLRAEATGVLANVYAQLGRSGKQAAALRTAIDLYLSAGDPTAAGVKLTLLAALSAQTGAETAALTQYHAGIALLRQRSAPVQLAHGLRQFARFHRDAGRPGTAIGLYRECLALLHDAHEPAGELCVHTELGVALLDTEHMDQAAEHITHATGLLDQMTEVPGYAAYVGMARGLLLARLGRTTEARAVLAEASVGLAAMPAAQARTLIELGRLLSETGEEHAALQARRAAADIAIRIDAKKLIELSASPEPR